MTGTRLGNAALALVYGKPIAWKSPSYSSASASAAAAAGGVSVTVTLVDTTGPLELRPPANLYPDGGIPGRLESPSDFNEMLWIRRILH